jgi:hypothetical protein
LHLPLTDKEIEAQREANFPKVSDIKEWNWDLNLSRLIPKLTLFSTESFQTLGSKLQTTLRRKT